MVVLGEEPESHTISDIRINLMRITLFITIFLKYTLATSSSYQIAWKHEHKIERKKLEI